MAFKEHLNEIVKEAEHYAEAKIEEASLKTVEQSVTILTGVLAWFVIAGVGMLVFASLSVVLFVVLSELLGSTLGASLILFGSYGLIFLILIGSYKKLLIKPLKNYLLGQYLNSHKVKKMNNIEKFEKLKELSQLKGEYHKRELLSLITFDSKEREEPSTNRILNWISVGKTGFALYRKIKSLIR